MRARTISDAALGSVLTLAGVFALAACGGSHAASFGPGKVDIPIGEPGRAKKDAGQSVARETPPPSGAAKVAPFPAVAREKLPNGVRVAVATSRALPIVQIRVVVRAGSGFGAPGVAELTAEMLKDGGTHALTSAELLRRVETLGADLSIGADFDATTLGLGVTKEHLGEALALLAQVVREPRFDGEELKKLKARATDEAEDAARSNGGWTARRLLFREIYPERTPYATYGLVPSEIAAVDGEKVRDFYRRFYVPKATSIVLTGDVDAASAKTAIDESFGSWTGGEPPKVDFAAPRAPGVSGAPAASGASGAPGASGAHGHGARVIVAHRPRSVQSDVFVAMLAPDRRSPAWAQVRVANQVLGGGVASRLFTDVREQRSLAYRTGSQIFELSHGEQPLVVFAGTETGKTSQAVAGLLENVARMKASPPSEAETESARRYLADVLAIRMETIGSIADMIVAEDTLGLPDGYWDAYRKDLRATDAAAAAEAAKKLYSTDDPLIVVAGDADVVAADLARFGDVVVVDPEKEFKDVRTLPKVGK